MNAKLDVHAMNIVFYGFCGVPGPPLTSCGSMSGGFVMQSRGMSSLPDEQKSCG
jgi:hypothetical protein